MYLQMCVISSGIRNCPAASIAQNILLTYLIYILYHFDLEPEVQGQIPSMQRQKGLIPMPKDFKVKFIPRRWTLQTSKLLAQK